VALFDIPVNTLAGQPSSLGTLAGKALLVVNVASKCGLTPQYTGLEQLQEQYAERGFSVVGFPCNQFGGQEPGDAREIADFCESKYDVSFPLFAKIDVNGVNAHPLYDYLKGEKSGLLGSSIKWNFTKFLVDRSGKVVGRYAPTTTPAQLTGDIEALL
jgi:glutathione peroxidase